jgi:hypothetical protein
MVGCHAMLRPSFSKELTHACAVSSINVGHEHRALCVARGDESDRNAQKPVKVSAFFSPVTSKMYSAL